MASFSVHPSSLAGSLTVPPSKSHTMRALFFAALAKGTSQIENFLPSPDTTAMIEAVRLFGAQVKVYDNCLEIRGCAGELRAPQEVIQCGNSGQVLRFLGALAGLLPHYTVLTGDVSLRQNRPVQPLLEGLQQLGVFAVSTLGNGYAPVVIKGPFTRATVTIDGADSQPISGLLLAAAFAPQAIEINVHNAGEKPWIDLTLYWLQKLGIPYQRTAYSYYRIEGNAEVDAFAYKVPGDFSTAAFPLVAALITQSELTLHNLDLSDCQGDKAIIPLLEKMGARFFLHNNSLTVAPGARLHGIKADINACIDTLPILAVVGCFAEGQMEIVNAAVARKKESDRIRAMAQELRKMGADIAEKAEGLLVYKSKLVGAELHSYHDHRVALALTTAALAAKGASKIGEVTCIAKTYPRFYEDFRTIGARIET